MHTRNVYLVLNLIPGCVLPQYHSCFDNFFETTRHGGPDLSGTICWQQLAEIDCGTAILSEVSTPTQRSIMYLETASEEHVPPEENSFTAPVFNVTASDDHSISEENSLLVLENV